MISNIAIIFTNPKEVFETAAKLNEEVKWTEFDRFSSCFGKTKKIGRENDPSKEK